MKKYTISLGTCTSDDGKVTTVYVLHPNILENEYCKQKAEFNNPNATDESIERIARQIVHAEVVQRLGEYEELCEIIKKKNVFPSWIKENDWIGYNLLVPDEEKLTKDEFNRVKEWLENE